MNLLFEILKGIKLHELKYEIVVNVTDKKNYFFFISTLHCTSTTKYCLKLVFDIVVVISEITMIGKREEIFNRIE